MKVQKQLLSNWRHQDLKIFLILQYPITSIRKTREKTAAELVKKVDLWPLKDQKPNVLSGGECQRVAVIRALINQPRLILADEPTGSLDEDNARAIISLLLDLNKQFDTALIVVTHSLDVGQRMDKTYTIQSGKLVHKL